MPVVLFGAVDVYLVNADVSAFAVVVGCGDCPYGVQYRCFCAHSVSFRWEELVACS